GDGDRVAIEARVLAHLRRTRLQRADDAVSIASNYDIGLDWLSVVFEVDKAPSEVACEDVALGQYQDRFVWACRG
ncbi:hypothetical protein, partial [Pseudomonas aeruginosa]